MKSSMSELGLRKRIIEQKYTPIYIKTFFLVTVNSMFFIVNALFSCTKATKSNLAACRLFYVSKKNSSARDIHAVKSLFCYMPNLVT